MLHGAQFRTNSNCKTWSQQSYNFPTHPSQNKKRKRCPSIIGIRHFNYRNSGHCDFFSLDPGFIPRADETVELYFHQSINPPITKGRCCAGQWVYCEYNSSWYRKSKLLFGWNPNNGAWLLANHLLHFRVNFIVRHALNNSWRTKELKWRQPWKWLFSLTCALS